MSFHFNYFCTAAATSVLTLYPHTYLSTRTRWLVPSLVLAANLCTMRIATANLLLVALFGVSSHATVHGGMVPSSLSQPLRFSARRKLQQQQLWLGQVG